MNKYLAKWLLMTMVVGMALLNTAAYAQSDLNVILTDSYPICIYDGEVPICGYVPVDFEKGVYVPEAAAEHKQNQKRYDEWLELCANTYGTYCQLYTHPKSRDFNKFDVPDEMSADELTAYVRENVEYLFDNDLLDPTRECPRRSLGEIKDVEYETISREYLIPLKDGKTAVLDTPDGYVFLGGTFEPVPYYIGAEKTALMSEQSGWQAVIYHGDVCSVQRFCGDDKAGYYHINEIYTWGDLVDKHREVDNLLILPIEKCRGMMATATQNWAVEQAIQQSQAEGFEDDWQFWKELHEGS